MADHISSNAILQAVDVLVNKRINDLDLDKTITAVIDKPLLSEGRGAHRVQYGGGFFTAYAREDEVYTPSTSVYVQVPQNDFTKRKTILGRASSYLSEDDLEVVSSVASDYMPIGRSLLTLEDPEMASSGFGLNTYSSKSYEKNGKTIPKTYQDVVLLYDREHPKNSQYNVDLTNLETYLKKARAIMLQADFRTSLTQEQQVQPNAEYGLVFDLAFKQTNSTFATQREMLTSLGNNIKAEQVTAEGLEYDLSINTYVERLDSIFKDQVDFDHNMYTSLQSVKTYIETIQSGVKSLVDKFESELTDQEYGIFKGFYYLCQDLTSSITINYIELYNIYKEWMEKSLVDEDIEKSDTKILSYALTSTRMTGAPFNFKNWISQYAIFNIDIANFTHIERIYFYCNDFIDNSMMWDWVNDNRYKIYDSASYTGQDGEPGWHGKDLWVKGLSFYCLQDIDNEYGDYKIKWNYQEDGTFYSLNKEETESVTCQVLYKNYTGVTDNCHFYWFKKDSRVASITHPDYNIYGGLGWAQVNPSTENRSKWTFSAADNKAYENEYMITAVYSNSAEGTIVLKTYFTLYNNMCKRKLTIVSDLGVSFSFGMAKPTLTCLIDDKESKFEEENLINPHPDSSFRFYWSSVDSSGKEIQYNVTYDELKARKDASLDYNNRLSLSSQMANYNGVEYPKGINGNQLIYPVGNIFNEASITFTCQVYTHDKGEGLLVAENEWYSIGSASITIENKGVATVSEYRVTFTNGNQVFQYSETGVAPTFPGTVSPTDFRHTEPQEILEVRPHLIAPTGLEVDEGLYSVAWRYPLENTLIIPTQEFTLDSATNLMNLVQSRTTKFDIQPSFNYNWTDNQLECVISYGGEVYTGKTNFFFGKVGDNGTNGTDIVARVEVVNDNNGILQDQPLTFYFTSSTDDPNVYSEEEVEGAKWNIGGTKNPILTAKLYNRSTEITENYRVSWKILGGTRNSYYFNFSDVDDENQALNDKTIRVYFDSSDKTSKLYHNQLIQAQISYEDKTYYAIYPICVIRGYVSNIRTLVNQGISFDYKSLLKQILYNADGRRPLYDKNQGVKLNGITGHLVTWGVDGGLNKTQAIPISLLDEKDGIEGSDILEDVGLDRVYILPSEEYDGASNDNRVTASVYLNQDSLNQINTFIKVQEQAEIDYKDALEQIRLDTSNEVKRHAQKNQEINTYYKKKLEELDDELIGENKEKNAKIAEIDWWQEAIASAEDVKESVKSFLVGEWSDEEFEYISQAISAEGVKVGEIQFLEEIDPDETLEEINSNWYKLSKKVFRGFQWLFSEWQLALDEFYEDPEYDCANALQEVLDAFEEEYSYDQLIDGTLYNQAKAEIFGAEDTESVQDIKKSKEQIETEYEKALQDENDLYQQNQQNLAQRKEDALTSKDNVIKNAKKEVSKYRKNQIDLSIPIYCALNTFGLASLNAWDGNSITINESENGEDDYILAPQIGAGTKNKANQFTGMVMGKVGTYADKFSDINETDDLNPLDDDGNKVGLVGYYNGQESMFLNSVNGAASFGLPPLNNPYTEGRIELRPGGVSRVGGWNFGNKDLFYAVDKKQKVLNELDSAHSKDYVPNNSGGISSGTSYNKHHEHDIGLEHSGVLLHSGSAPYISIKGHPLDPSGADSAVLNANDAESYISEGDSLEVQLDPQTPTLFTIFRHNGVERKNSNGDVLYPKGSRTFLAGINARGQLMANGLQSAIKTEGASGNDSISTLGIDSVPAFSFTSENTPYIGLKILNGTGAIAKLFIKDPSATGTADNTLYLSGSLKTNNEYERPLSLHGYTVGLYASNANSTAKTTGHKLEIKNENVYLGTKTSDSIMSYINLNTTTGNSTVWKNTSDVKFDFSKAYEVDAASYTLRTNGNWNIRMATNNTTGTGMLRSPGAMTLLSKSSVSIGRVTDTTADSYTYQTGDPRAIFSSSGTIIGHTGMPSGQPSETLPSNRSYLFLGPGSSSYTRLQGTGDLHIEAGGGSYLHFNSGTATEWRVGTNKKSGSMFHQIQYLSSGKWQIVPSLDLYGDLYIKRKADTGTATGNLTIQAGDLKLESGDITVTGGIGATGGVNGSNFSWNEAQKGSTSGTFDNDYSSKSSWAHINNLYKGMNTHTHSFSKGITVNVSNGGNSGVSVTQGAAGSNATINVTATATSNATLGGQDASYTKGKYSVDIGSVKATIWVDKYTQVASNLDFPAEIAKGTTFYKYDGGGSISLFEGNDGHVGNTWVKLDSVDTSNAKVKTDEEPKFTPCTHYVANNTATVNSFSRSGSATTNPRITGTSKDINGRGNS